MRVISVIGAAVIAVLASHAVDARSLRDGRTLREVRMAELVIDIHKQLADSVCMEGEGTTAACQAKTDAEAVLDYLGYRYSLKLNKWYFTGKPSIHVHEDQL